MVGRNESDWSILSSWLTGLKHVTWRFRICNYFREIFKVCDFMKTFRNFTTSVFAHIFANFKYFAKKFVLTESPDHVL